jgi:hypothetical protein
MKETLNIFIAKIKNGGKKGEHMPLKDDSYIREQEKIQRTLKNLGYM